MEKHKKREVVKIFRNIIIYYIKIINLRKKLSEYYLKKLKKKKYELYT